MEQHPAARDLAFPLIQRKSTVAPLPRGQAEAWFEVDTGQDVVDERPREPRLAVVVRYLDRELRQTFESCKAPSKGSALGDLGGELLDVAACDHLYWLVAETGGLRVERHTEDGNSEVKLRVSLPQEVLPVAFSPKKEP